jgi:magnesium-transporting ATPase (P-type)
VRDTVHWHALTAAETLERLGTSLDGLATREAERRLQQFGPNEIETAPPPSLLRIILHQFKSPLIYYPVGGSTRHGRIG